MFDIRVFNALATQTSIKIGQISFNVTTPGQGNGSECRDDSGGSQGARRGGLNAVTFANA